jgi:hypothetical protein
MGERLTRQPRSPAQMEKGMSLNITTPVVHAGAWDAFLIDDTLLDVFFCNNDKPNFFFWSLWTCSNPTVNVNLNPERNDYIDHVTACRDPVSRRLKTLPSEHAHTLTILYI